MVIFKKWSRGAVKEVTACWSKRSLRWFCTKKHDKNRFTKHTTRERQGRARDWQDKKAEWNVTIMNPLTNGQDGVQTMRSNLPTRPSNQISIRSTDETTNAKLAEDTLHESTWNEMKEEGNASWRIRRSSKRDEIGHDKERGCTRRREDDKIQAK